MPPDNFGGLSEEDSLYEKARAVIFPMPLERTTTYEHGTRNGPAAILAASRNMELYDEELDTETYKEIGIATAAGDRHDGWHARRSDRRNFHRAVRTSRRREISGRARRRAFADAAAGLRRARRNTRTSAFCRSTRTRICATNIRGIPTAMRARCAAWWSFARRCRWEFVRFRVEEANAIPRLKTKIYWANDIVRAPLEGWIAKVLADLSPNVYLTIDLDGFDPSIVPATGTPEPGGLDWHQVTSLIRAVASHKKIVGMDVVELLPQPGDHASDFLAAKLSTSAWDTFSARNKLAWGDVDDACSAGTCSRLQDEVVYVGVTHAGIYLLDRDRAACRMDRGPPDARARIWLRGGCDSGADRRGGGRLDFYAAGNCGAGILGEPGCGDGGSRSAGSDRAIVCRRALNGSLPAG